jgi:hypothetical protein
VWMAKSRLRRRGLTRYVESGHELGGWFCKLALSDCLVWIPFTLYTHGLLLKWQRALCYVYIISKLHVFSPPCRPQRITMAASY